MFPEDKRFNESQFEQTAREITEQLAFFPREFQPLDWPKLKFISFTSFYLEYYGGTTTSHFLLKHYQRVLTFSSEDVEKIFELMHYNPALGVDCLLEFYLSYTSVPLSDFEFLGEMKGIYLNRLESMSALLNRHREEKYEQIDLEVSFDKHVKHLSRILGIPEKAFRKLKNLKTIHQPTT